ncbi:response regulator [Lysinibacillus sphaericus]|uniref:Two-component response regulator n=1 Tax=Lysinibacillus sphaericus OT4b.31 TaxID=1285586 RepID=R7ZH01_LYSSH|nr:response regulator [Lysinibacillus sphaericus]EON73402.1 two-component response regulator [Lysinibacillus sphaericus OT4b.31]
MDIIHVLLIEDDPMVREVNRQFIEQIEGFSLVGYAGNGIEGIDKIKELKPELVFMDIFMPEQDGIITLGKIREEHLAVDVIAVTAANDMSTVQRILHLGVYDYIMKPFTFERIEQTLKNYQAYKVKITSMQDLTQHDVDHLMQQRIPERTSAPQVNQTIEIDELPKGFNRATLDKVLAYIQGSKEAVSAEEVSTYIGTARVTARRYLDFLEKQNLLKVDIQYGSVGRPIHRYYI